MGEVRYTETVDVAAPPERAWSYRLDFSRLPEINPNVSGLRRTDGGTAPGVGAAYAFDVTIPGMGGPIPTTLVVTEAERPTRIANEMRSGLDAHEVCTFTPTPDGGTRIEFAVTVLVPDEGDTPELRSLIERSGREQVRLELELMKQRLEGRA